MSDSNPAGSLILPEPGGGVREWRHLLCIFFDLKPLSLTFRHQRRESFGWPRGCIPSNKMRGTQGSERDQEDPRGASFCVRSP